MSTKNKYSVIIALGLAILFSGLAIRSSIVMHNYANKPFGGVLVAVGMLVIGIYGYKLLKR